MVFPTSSSTGVGFVPFLVGTERDDEFIRELAGPEDEWDPEDYK